MLILSIIQGVCERGLIYGLIVLGIYISSRVIRFDDLTIEGSFGLGGVITAICLLYGINGWISLLGAIIGGMVAGAITGILHTKLKLNNLMSGMITSTALFSICLKLGSSSMLLPKAKIIFYEISQPVLLLIPMIVTIILFIAWFLRTEIGFLLRIVGSSPIMLQNLGKSVGNYTILGLVLANGIQALAGAVLTQYLGYYSIWFNVGILVIGFTSLIIAEMISKKCGLHFIIGAILYQLIIAFTFECNIDQDWNKLITAMLLIALLGIRQLTNKGK